MVCLSWSHHSNALLIRLARGRSHEVVVLYAQKYHSKLKFFGPAYRTFKFIFERLYKDETKKKKAHKTRDYGNEI